MKKELLAVLGVVAAVVCVTVVCPPAKADSQMDDEVAKWKATPSRPLTANEAEKLLPQVRDKLEDPNAKFSVTAAKTREFPGGHMTVVCGIAGDRVFSMLLTVYDGDPAKSHGSLYLNGFDNRIAKVCASWGF